MGYRAEACVLVEEAISSYNPPVLIITFILGFIGNAVALWIFSFHVKSWKPNTVYSLNLAIADTLLICCLPFRADYYIRGKNWIYGDVPCRLKIFLIFLNRTTSVILLTVMAIDRYLKVVHPHHRVNKIPTSCAVKVAACLWVFAVAISLHFVTECHVFMHDNRTYCEPLHIHQPFSMNAIWTDIVFILFKFALPFSIIVFSTSCIVWKLKQMKTAIRRKYKRGMKLVIAVAVVFVLCFLPTNIAVIAVLLTKHMSTVSCQSTETAVQVFYNTLCITYLNSVLDPVIYYFSSSTFKDSLKKALDALHLRRFESETNPTGPAKGKQSVDSSKLSSVDHICDQVQT